jgi:linoleate 9S-lipoxygenase
LFAGGFSADSSSERPVELVELVYVPRDERFQRIKKSQFLGSSIKSFAHGTLTVLDRLIEGRRFFEHIDEVKELYSKGIGIDVGAILPLSEEEKEKGLENVFELARQIIDPSTGDTHFLKFPVPQVIEGE